MKLEKKIEKARRIITEIEDLEAYPSTADEILASHPNASFPESENLEEIQLSEVSTWRHHHKENDIIVTKGHKKNRGNHFIPYGEIVSQYQFDGYYHSHIVIRIDDCDIIIPIRILKNAPHRFDKLMKHPEVIDIISKIKEKEK